MEVGRKWRMKGKGKGHALSRKATDPGVSELTRFENWSAGSSHRRTRSRSWLSTSASLRCDVASIAPVGVPSQRQIISGGKRRRTERQRERESARGALRYRGKLRGSKRKRKAYGVQPAS